MIEICGTDGKTRNLQTVLQSGEPYNGKILVKDIEGGNHSIDGSMSYVHDQSGEPIRLLVLGNDVTRDLDVLGRDVGLLPVVVVVGLAHAQDVRAVRARQRRGNVAWNRQGHVQETGEKTIMIKLIQVLFELSPYLTLLVG